MHLSCLVVSIAKLLLRPTFGNISSTMSYHFFNGFLILWHCETDTCTSLLHHTNYLFEISVYQGHNNIIPDTDIKPATLSLLTQCSNQMNNITTCS